MKIDRLVNQRMQAISLAKYVRVVRFPISFKKRVFSILCGNIIVQQAFNELIGLSQKISELFVRELFITSAIHRFSLKKHGDIPYHFALFDEWVKRESDSSTLSDFYLLYVTDWRETIEKYGLITLSYYETIRRIEDEPFIYGPLHSNYDALIELINLSSLDFIAEFIYESLLRFILPADSYDSMSVDLECVTEHRGKDVYTSIDILIPGLVLLVAFDRRNNFTKFARCMFLIDRMLNDSHPQPKRYIVLNVYSCEVVFFTRLSSTELK